MRTLLVIAFVLMSLVSFQSWASELDGKYLNCTCKSDSQNCIDDFDAKGNEKKIALRKHKFFRIFSISFRNGKALRFYPVENDESDGIVITGTSLNDPPKYVTTMDEILIPFLGNQENLLTETSIDRKTLIYKEEWQLKYDTGFKVWFSSVATCKPDDSMFVFELQNILQQHYETIKRENKF